MYSASARLFLRVGGGVGGENLHEHGGELEGSISHNLGLDFGP